MQAPLKRTNYDVVVVGSGHNGLVAAAYLARNGLSVAVLERNHEPGGATVSQRVFPDYDARLSRYSYLVSLLPSQIVSELQLDFITRARQIASCTPYQRPDGQPAALLLSNVSADRSRASMGQLCGNDSQWPAYLEWCSRQQALAEVLWPTLLLPMQSRRALKSGLTAAQLEGWQALVERPLGESLEATIEHDLVRGLLFTDAKIGVFTHPHDPSLLQNRCFLYHTIGQGTGQWRVPVGGMQALTDALLSGCMSAGVEIITSAAVEALTIGPMHTVEFASQERQWAVDARYVLINAAPRTLARMTGTAWTPEVEDEGSAIKVNMLLRRLPRLRAMGVSSQEAFTGSFHVAEGYEQMQRSYAQAEAGHLPEHPPFEIYCHTLTDASILAPELQQNGYHTLTLFGLDVPYRLFGADLEKERTVVLNRYLDALDELCIDSFRDCLALSSDGFPCVEIKLPQDLEADVGLDRGNIFHNAPSWFFADDEEQVGTWGVETEWERVYLAGSSARRGGAVSGIPGRNAAMAVLNNQRLA